MNSLNRIQQIESGVPVALSFWLALFIVHTAWKWLSTLAPWLQRTQHWFCHFNVSTASAAQTLASTFTGFDQSWCAKPQQLWTKILHARHKQRIDSYRGPAARFSSKDLEKFHWPGRNFGNNNQDKSGTIFLKCGCYALQTKVFNTLFWKL